MENSVKHIDIQAFSHQKLSTKSDIIAIEEPLEIIVAYGEAISRQRHSLSITMRTPTKQDNELALGFLFTEGIIKSINDVASIRYISNSQNADYQYDNSILVELHAYVKFDISQLQRHFYTTSSCGICGKGSIDLVQKTSRFFLNQSFPKVELKTILNLPEQLQKTQNLFEKTGGIHASALFDVSGQLLCLREDVGRHNALDKLIGWALKNEEIPLNDKILLLSGRISFELVQKAAMIGIPIICAFGAPSSLAVELADESTISLIGFLNQNRCNLYTWQERILL